MRTLVDIPEDDVAWLDRRASEKGQSRAALVREAVSAYRMDHAKDWIDEGAGYWADRADIGDGLAYQRTIREDRNEP